MAVTGKVAGFCVAGAAVAAISVGVAWAGGPPGAVEEMSEAVGSGYVGDSLAGFRAGGTTNDEAKQAVIAACQAAGGTECSADEVTNDNLCIVSIGDVVKNRVEEVELEVMERAEANRVAHLVRGHVDAATIREQQAKIARYEELLGRLLSSSSMGVAERLTKLKQRGNPVFTRQEIQDLLDQD